MAPRIKVDMSKAREIKRHTDGREIYEQGSHRWVAVNQCGLWECVDCKFVYAEHGHPHIVPNCKTVQDWLKEKDNAHHVKT